MIQETNPKLPHWQCFSVDFGQFPARIQEIEKKYDILEKYISCQLMPVQVTHNPSGIQFAKPQMQNVILISGLLFVKEKVCKHKWEIDPNKKSKIKCNVCGKIEESTNDYHNVIV